jgi:hypothetical protein
MRLYLAPHYDDPLLSIPSILASDTHDMCAAVAVVFSDESDALERDCRALYASLGVEVWPLGFQEAVRRGCSARDCLRPGRTAAGPGSAAAVKAVTERLMHTLDREPCRACELWAPLLPVHLDHAIVREAAEKLATEREGTAIVYYADQPYALLCPRALDRECASLVRAVELERLGDPAAASMLLAGATKYISSRDAQRLFMWRRTAAHAEPVFRSRRPGGIA